MSPSSPRVHDRFFKQIFTRPENVRDFITTYLPAEIVAHLDLESLEVVSGNYVEADLGEYFSDVVVKTRVMQGNPADLYFLFEHKSGPEWYARVQVLQYMASRWYTQIRDGQSGPLPLIIPVVIYHGPRTWSFSLGFEDLFDPPSAEYLPYIPKFEHILHDISHLNESEIKGTIVLQAVQLLLKYIQSPELRDHLPRIVDMLGSLAEKERLTEYLQVILEYIFQASENVDVSDIHNALKLIPQGEELMPTIAEKLRQEGVQQGMQQGIQQGMQQGELQGKRIILLKQMQRKFILTSGEESLITSVQDQATLDQALESVLFAQDKFEVLGLLR